MSLYRYQKLPVIIYEQDMTRKLANQEKEEKAEKVGLNEGHFDGAKNEKRDGDFATAKINNFLSGTYLIGKITYKFSRDTGMIQNLTLLRREWPVQMKQLPDSPST